MILLTICIPTYNRSKLLGKLLERLDSLNNNQFEVIVVDDGSTDKTFDLYSSRNDYSFRYKYIKKRNGGKNSAVNYGLSFAKSIFFMDMDTDDSFVSEQFENIFSVLNEKKNCKLLDFSGFSFLCVDKDKNIIGDSFCSSPLYESLVKVRVDYKVRGDKKEIIRTDILRKFIVNGVSNEKRVPTSHKWLRISNNYKCYHLNIPFIEKDYLNDGLSNRLLSIRLNSLSNNCHYYNELSLSNCYDSLLFRVKSIINFWRFYIRLNSCNCDFTIPLYFYFIYPLGFIFYLRDSWLK